MKNQLCLSFLEKASLLLPVDIDVVAELDSARAVVVISPGLTSV